MLPISTLSERRYFYVPLFNLAVVLLRIGSSNHVCTKSKEILTPREMTCVYLGLRSRRASKTHGG